MRLLAAGCHVGLVNADRAFLHKQIVDFKGFYEAIAAGDNEGDAAPAVGDDGGQLVVEGTKLKLVIPLPCAGVIGLGGDQVAAGHQFVALDGGVVVDGPAILAEGFGGVLDTNRKTPFR